LIAVNGMPVDFSVIIPTFRRPTELLSTISSVLAQHGIEIEVFVIDDSPEGSAQALVETLDDRRLTYVKNPKPSGGVPSLVRNLGWPLAQGAFVHFLDDDDIVPEDHYAIVKETFIAHPEVGVVFGRVEPFGDAPKEQMHHEREFFAAASRKALISSRFGPRWAFTARMMFDGLLLVTGAGVVRRECVRLLDGFDARIGTFTRARCGVLAPAFSIGSH
jgi:glycosyltransferase involved in cell wall biosynthesis